MRSTAAGSTDPAKIQAALKATDLKPDQLMIGYKGVKFDDKGQNILASGLLIQLQGRRKLCRRLAEDQRREDAGDALQGLVTRPGRERIIPPFFCACRDCRCAWTIG